MQGPIARLPSREGRKQALPRGSEIAEERFCAAPIIQRPERIGMGPPQRSREAIEKPGEATLRLGSGPL